MNVMLKMWSVVLNNILSDKTQLIYCILPSNQWLWSGSCVKSRSAIITAAREIFWPGMNQGKRLIFQAHWKYTRSARITTGSNIWFINTKHKIRVCSVVSSLCWIEQNRTKRESFLIPIQKYSKKWKLYLFPHPANLSQEVMMCILTWNKDISLINHVSIAR